MNLKPETLPDSLVFGDSAFGEAIDVPGDVDEFRVTVPDSSGANLVAWMDAAADSGALAVGLVDSTDRLVTELRPLAPGSADQTGTFHLPPGTYTLRVQGYAVFGDGRSPLLGGYRVWLYRFGFGPEVAPDTIAIGDTIGSEALDPPGDVDGFTFFASRGDHINVALQGLGTPDNGGFQAVLGPADGAPPQYFVTSPLAADSLGAYQTNRIDLAATGWYRLTIGGGSSPPQLTETGPYRVSVTSLASAPEHVGAALVPGDSVTGEALEVPGDWDEYTLTATPGQFVAVQAQAVSGNGYPELAIYDPATDDTLSSVVLQDFDKVAGPIAVPASGVLRVAVFQPRAGYVCYDDCDAAFPYVGAYGFTVVPVNPAPENVSSTYATGDTVRGEAITPASDIDEFAGTGTPGAVLAPGYRLTADPVPSGSHITLEIVDPATGAVLVGSGASLIGSSPDFVSPGTFVVPADGTYVIRVRSGGLSGYEFGTAPYEFFVAPAP